MISNEKENNESEKVAKFNIDSKIYNSSPESKEGFQDVINQLYDHVPSSKVQLIEERRKPKKIKSKRA